MAVRLIREFEGSRGGVWREYATGRGRVVVEARAPGMKRKRSKAATAREAARQMGVRP
jgi:hypothetical protein